MSSIGFVCQLFILPFSEILVEKIGCANAILFNVVIEAGRFFAYSWIHENPPYYALGEFFRTEKTF